MSRLSTCLAELKWYKKPMAQSSPEPEGETKCIWGLFLNRQEDYSEMKQPQRQGGSLPRANFMLRTEVWSWNYSTCRRLKSITSTPLVFSSVHKACKEKSSAVLFPLTPIYSSRFQRDGFLLGKVINRCSNKYRSGSFTAGWVSVVC